MVRGALQVICSCGNSGYVAASLDGYYTKCPRCHNEIFGLTCDKCESGFAFPKDAKEIKSGEWKCSVCRKRHKFIRPKKKVKFLEKRPTIDMKEELKRDLKKTIITYQNASLLEKPVKPGWIVLTKGEIIFYDGKKQTIIKLKEIKILIKKKKLLFFNTGLEIEAKNGKIFKFAVHKRDEFCSFIPKNI